MPLFTWCRVNWHKKAHEFCCSEQGRISAVCKSTIFALVLSLDCYNSELHAASLKARKLRKTLCISCSEIKDMAVCLHVVSMLFWNLPTFTGVLILLSNRINNQCLKKKHHFISVLVDFLWKFAWLIDLHCNRCNWSFSFQIQMITNGNSALLESSYQESMLLSWTRTWNRYQWVCQERWKYKNVNLITNYLTAWLIT